MCERTLSDEHVDKISNLYPEKTAKFCRFEYPKRSFLRYLRGFQHFSDFQILSDLGRSKSVLGPFFPFLTKIWLESMYHTNKFKILDLTFLTLWPWFDTRSQKARSIPGTIRIVSAAKYRYSNLIRPLCPAKPAVTNGKKSDIWPDL